MPKIKGHGQAEIFSDNDYRRIRQQITNPKHRLIFDIARWTGERMGAVLQLRVDDVYEPDGTPRTWITFRAQTRKGSPTGERKTRQCPVHDNLRDILRAYQPPVAGPLFPGDGGCLSFQSAYSFLNKAIGKAGLEHKGFSSHSFRRTLITRLSERGCDVRTIQQVTGHSDIKSLMRYIEADPKRVQRAIALL